MINKKGEFRHGHTHRESMSLDRGWSGVSIGQIMPRIATEPLGARQRA